MVYREKEDVRRPLDALLRRGFVATAGARAGLVVVAVAMAAFAAVTLSSCKSTPAKADAGSGASAAGGEAPAIGTEIPAVEGAGPVLVVYFSQGSATKRVAQDLASLFGAELEEIREKKARSGGFFGFMGAGADATFKKATPIQTPVADPADYKMVIVLTPVWSWSLSPPVRNWLLAFKGRLPDCAYVTVSGDTEPDKIVAMMTQASGKAPLAFASFIEKDFAPEGRQTYVSKLAELVDRLR